MEREIIFGTDQLAIADVAVFQLSAVRVLQAVAGYRKPGTLPGSAFVRHGARVTIVTIGLIEGVLATSQSIAEVICAGVLIVAGDGGTQTNSGLAMITNGAGISVQAFPRIKVVVAATGLTIAEVLGTRITVATERQKLPTLFVRFIDEAIAVIVLAIAHFGHRHRRVTGAQPFLPTNTLPVTGSKSTLLLTGSGERQ